MGISEEEFAAMRQRMAQNAMPIGSDPVRIVPSYTEGLRIAAPVGWPVHVFEAVGGDFPDTCVHCACFRDSVNHSVEWPEHMIEAECTRLLEQDGWRGLRTDPVSDRSRGKGFGELGMADHWFGRPLPSAGPYACEMLWCEFKAGRNKAEKHQREWHDRERARGFKTWIANEDFPATVDGFREHYAKSGLMRRARWW